MRTQLLEMPAMRAPEPPLADRVADDSQPHELFS
jgi:hypothetical protein